MIALAPDPPLPASEDQARTRRILLIVHGYPPRQTTGAEVQARRKARWWRERGHEVIVLAADPQPASEWPFGRVAETVEQVDGIPVRRLRFAVPDATRPLAETYAHPLLDAAIEREIARARPDLVYQVSGYLLGAAPLLLAARVGIPTVLFAMDYWHACQRVTLLRPDGTPCAGTVGPADCAACRIADRAFAQRLGPVGNRAIRALVAGAGRIVPGGTLGAALGVSDFAARRATIAEALRGLSLAVVNSRFLADRLAMTGVPEERILVVRQGIDAGEFAALPPRLPRGDELRALYLGQISWHKGADLAVEAVAQLRASGGRATLRLHGPVTAPAPYLAELRRRIARAGGDEAVRLGDSLERTGLVAALREADVLIVPSRWYENSPNVILEAFAAGTPVIVADHGGMAEMVRDGEDGLRFAPGDARALAGALGRLCAEPDLLPRLQAGILPPRGLAEEMAAEDAALDRLCTATARPS